MVHSTIVHSKELTLEHWVWWQGSTIFLGGKRCGENRSCLNQWETFISGVDKISMFMFCLYELYKSDFEIQS